MSMSGRSFEVPVHVRFTDVDMLGVVNNACYLTYLEEARVAFFRHLDVGLAERVILARSEVDYRGPGRLGDDVRVHLWVDEIGESSFTLAYEVRAGAERRLADARTVQVHYDYAEGAPRALTTATREALSPYLHRK